MDAYQEATAAGPPSTLQPMLALGSARALKGLGRTEEAAAAAGRFLASEHAPSCPAPVVGALKELADATGLPSQGRPS